MNILGIDLGGTKILGVRANEWGEVLDRVQVDTHATEGPEAVLGRMVAVMRGLTPPEGVDAIGIASPGPLDPWKGEVYEPPNLPGWVKVPLRRRLREMLGYAGEACPPLVVVNDANAAALGEYTYGAGSEKALGRKIGHLVYLTISTGVGGGVIIDGKLLLGANGFAAELGHIVVDWNGTRCTCGGVGCIEAMASGTALAREGAMVVSSRKPTLLAEMAGGNPANVTAKMVVDAAKAGDRLALDLMEREGVLVAAAVVTCIHTFNPELVVLGGGVANAGDLLFDTVRQAVAARVGPGFAGTYEIVPAALQGLSGALGAVAAAATTTDAGQRTNDRRV